MSVIESILSLDWEDIGSRALWTFLEAFLASALIAGESMIDLLFNADWDRLWVLLLVTAVSATAAGLSALKTIVVETIRRIQDKAEYRK